MSRETVGVIVNGATGRMGYRQHLVRSLLAIRDQGGLAVPDGTVLWPEPILVGRSVDRLKAVADRHGLDRWTTSLDEALADPGATVYFDAQVTAQRVPPVLAAIAAGKHVYVEKPTADGGGIALEEAYEATADDAAYAILELPIRRHEHHADEVLPPRDQRMLVLVPVL